MTWAKPPSAGWDADVCVRANGHRSGFALIPYPYLQFLEGELDLMEPEGPGRDGLMRRHRRLSLLSLLIWHVPLPLPPALSHTLLAPPPRLPSSLVRSPRLSRQYAITLKNKENILGVDKLNICMSVFREIPICGGIKLFFFSSSPSNTKYENILDIVA